jgi:ribosome-associated toxin RatA of RatAB toxin-antitoxin module
MKHVKRSVLLWYSPREMYELVTGVEHYPVFLPWCEQAEVIEQHADGVTARLTLAKAGVRHAFTTRNTHRAHREVHLALIDGPFSVLQGHWRFAPVANAGKGAGGEPAACKVAFDLQYAFSSPALEALVSPIFDRVAGTLVDSFVIRAEQVYGSR